MISPQIKQHSKEYSSVQDLPASETTFSLKIITGDTVFELIERSDFVSSWYDLAALDSKFTAIQEPPFVETWYRTYFQRYFPILCLGYSKSGKLVGLMPIAKHRESGDIAHAGFGQAEYHGWICVPKIDDEFPLACVIEIGRRFQPRVWKWRWLPPGASIHWLSSEQFNQAGIYVKFVVRPNSVLDLHDEEYLQQIRKRKSLKNNINRHKRSGSFYLERIIDKERTENLMKIIAVQYDVRAGGAYRVSGFQGDKFKKSFFVERQNYPTVNHFTVLWSSGEVLAFNFGACDKNRVLLGLFSYNPVQARTSPGTIFLVELARALREEGFRYLDLTPGRQQFKAQLANRQEDLVLPTFYFTRSAKIFDDFEDWIGRAGKPVLQLFGVNDPYQRQRFINRLLKLRSKFSRATSETAWRKFIRVIYRKVEYHYYRIDCSTRMVVSEPDTEIGVQRYSDLLAYTGSNPRLSKTDFLERSLTRLNAGQTFYSIVQNSVLAHYGWLQPMQEEHNLSNVSAKLVVPSGSIMLYDFYTEPAYRRQGLYCRTLQQMISDCCRTNATNVFIAVEKNNWPSRSAIEKAGFSFFRGFTETRFLGWVWRKEY